MLNNWRMAEIFTKEAPDRGHRARAVGSALQPDAGGQDLAAPLRRAHLPQALPRRRPYGAGDDPDPPGEGPHDRRQRLHGDHRNQALQGRFRPPSARWPTPASPAASSTSRRRPSYGYRRVGPHLQGHLQLVGGDRRRVRPRLRDRARSSWTWRWCSSIQRAWSGPPACGILVTEGVRGEGGSCATPMASATWRSTIPRRWSSVRATWWPGPTTPRSRRAAAASTAAYTWTSRPGYDGIMKKLPTMYEQFLKLADIDISREPMEVFPTVHYTMGGIKVDPRRAPPTCLASSLPVSAAAGCTGRTVSAATRSPTCSSSAGGPAWGRGVRRAERRTGRGRGARDTDRDLGASSSRW